VSRSAASCLKKPSIVEPTCAVAPAGDEGGPLPWLAVWTRARHEVKVRNQLTARGLETFLPTMARSSRWKDRTKRIDWPLFPGYCFVRLHPLEALRALSCTGVVSLVSFNGQPAAVDEAEIAAVRRLVESDLRVDPCPFIHEGDPVEVVCGPLRGVVGRLVKKGAKARLIVAVGLLGQGLTVDVDAGDVRAY
jgi:transcriptional antiterminator NusG